MNRIHSLLSVLLLAAATLHPFTISHALSANATDTPLHLSSAVHLNTASRVIGARVVQLETPVQVRAFFYLNLACYNAWTAFHPSAADIFGRVSFKLPETEHTTENISVSGMYAVLRIFQASPGSFGGPESATELEQRFSERGLNTLDMSEDLNTAVGIGNRIGRDTAQLMKLDGWNANDESNTNVRYRLPFRDASSYTPVNDPWHITHPFRWQPLLESDGKGFFFRQEFVTPHIGSGIAFGLSPSEVRDRRVKNPYGDMKATIANASREDWKLLRTGARAVLKISNRLTERQRVLAEFFDNKVRAFPSVSGIGEALRFAVMPGSNVWSKEDDMFYGLGAQIATFDATMLAWKEKRRVDAARPTDQLMDLLFPNETFRVWRGPGDKSRRIFAGEWQPFLRTMPHAEHPSASACLCTALIEHARQYAGTNDLSYSTVVGEGSSQFYPNEVPTRDVTLRFERLSDWERLCGKSRLWAGVHFPASVDEGHQLCRGVGRRADRLVRRLREGRNASRLFEWLPHHVPPFWDL